MRISVIFLLSCFLISCTPGKNTIEVQSFVQPMAVLQAGKYPLWFQLTAEGPALIETIEDACFSAALIPWPLAPHIRYILAQDNKIMAAVNRYGFICLSPWDRSGTTDGIGLYRFSGGELWQQYTVGSFVFTGREPGNIPLALLYMDDRFVDLDLAVPSPRLFTFVIQSVFIETPDLPLLDAFSPEDGWNIDTLRLGTDGYWYFRTVRKTAGNPEIFFFRSSGLTQTGERISRGAFQRAALPEPVSAAPEALQEMLNTVFSETGFGAAAVVSPDFQSIRNFAIDRESEVIFGFFDGSFLLAASAHGDAFYLEKGMLTRRFSLPPIPEGFVYTGISVAADTIFASWEEQDGYSIGAAGFMVMLLQN
jgi:hypothetical protein